MSKGIMVYANDSNVIAQTKEDLNKCPNIIETYCALYDISINAKKNKLMHFGEPTNIIEPIIKIDGDTLEKVKFFKFH